MQLPLQGQEKGGLETQSPCRQRGGRHTPEKEEARRPRPGDCKGEKEAQEAAKNAARTCDLMAASRKPPRGLRAQASSAHLGSSKGCLRGPCPQALSPLLFYTVCRKNLEGKKKKKGKEQKEQKLKNQNPIDPALKPNTAPCQLCDSGTSVTSGKWEQKRHPDLAPQGCYEDQVLFLCCPFSRALVPPCPGASRSLPPLLGILSGSSQLQRVSWRMAVGKGKAREKLPALPASPLPPFYHFPTNRGCSETQF